MKLRSLNKESDISIFVGLHRMQKLDYPLPEPEEFVEDEILVDDNGKPVMRIAALNMVELYLLIDPEYETPGMRFEHFKLLHEHMRKKLAARGIVGAHIFLPPQLSKSFGRRLRQKLGWIQSTWTCLFRRI